MKSSAKNIQIASYDDLFKTDEERLADTQERIQVLPLDKLLPFPNHPFKVVEDEKMQDTVDSIKEYGVLVPILVRPKDDGNYEIISGHRRHHASILAGKTEIPAIIREMDDDAAILAMVDSNLQRETILPSEKAFAYKMKLEAMKRQGARLDLTSAQFGRKLDGKESREILAEQTGESRNQISRYIRLTNLQPELLEMVDNKQMAFNSAVEVSYLDENEQTQLYEVLETNECCPSLSQASRLKKYSQDGKLDVNVMDAIMSEEKAIESKLVLKGDTIRKYFPKSYTPIEMQNTIIKLLEEWQKKQQRQQER
jgi:ParB family transcriptional regulator, chromosome partitioning protein